MKSAQVSMVFGALLVGACGSGSVVVDAGVEPDAGPVAVDAGPVEVDAGPAEADAGAPVAALNGCADADFLDLRAATANDRMIMVPRGTNTFDNPCITIAPGQEAIFMWDFASHPLAPGAAPGQSGGTEPSPIVPQTSGALYTVAFPTAGDYPYYCTLHASSGMTGVVRVAAAP